MIRGQVQEILRIEDAFREDSTFIADDIAGLKPNLIGILIQRIRSALTRPWLPPSTLYHSFECGLVILALVLERTRSFVFGQM